MNMINERRRMRGQGGFTLIELLVVIAILAILGGVAIFAVNGLTTNAGENACKVEKDTIATAAQAAIAKTGVDTTWKNYTNLGSGNPKYWNYTPTNTGTAATPAANTTTNPAPGDCTTVA